MPFWAYVSNDGSNEIQVVDLTTRREIMRISVPPGPFGIALTPDGAQLWAPLDVSRTIAVIETATAALIRQIHLPDPGLVDLVISPDGRTAYGLSWNGVVYVADTASTEVQAVLGVGGENTERMRLNPDGSELWVVDEATGSLIVVDTAVRRVAERMRVGEAVADVAFTPDGAKAYVPDLEGGAVLVLEPQKRQVVKRIPIKPPDALPRAVAVSSDGRKAYVTLYQADRVVVVDTMTDELTGELYGSFDGPNGIAVTPDGRFAVVVSQVGDRTAVIELESEQQVATLPFPGRPRQVVIGEMPAFERVSARKEALRV